MEQRKHKGYSMGNIDEKRSQSGGIAGAYEGDTRPVGVGGRQGQPPTPTQGGGWLNVYTPFKPRLGGLKKIARDPRLDELRQMGLHATWQRVAEEIGVDAFLAMWRIVDKEEQWHHVKGTLVIPLRHYASYTKFQRNQFINDLFDTGLSMEQIRRRLLTAYGETVDSSHITRIVKKHRI